MELVGGRNRPGKGWFGEAISLLPLLINLRKGGSGEIIENYYAPGVRLTKKNIYRYIKILGFLRN